MLDNTVIEFSRKVQIRYDVDVFVAGGGPAGIAAAVSAARSGCSVYLAEGQACLGGMGTAGMIPAFMQFTDGINFLAAGIGEEIFEKTCKVDKLGQSIKVESLKRIYDNLLIEAKVGFSFQTQLIGVEMNGDKVKLAILSSKSGIFAVKAKMFVDGTGDGDLAVFAGASYEKGDSEGNMMPGTLCSLWAGIDWDKFDWAEQEKNLEKAFQDKIFTVEDRHLPGMWRVGKTIGGGNIGHAFGVDGTNEVSLTKALVEQRKKLTEYEKYYKGYLEGFKEMELVATASLLGIRETRRIIGDYVLNLDDFKNRAIFYDEIGRYSYPVDVHASKPGIEDFKKFEDEYKNLRYSDGESYGIPYRCLIPQGVSNVLIAGRCVSSDRYIQGSVRVMPGCYITGQAAGAAAAIAINEDTDTRGFDIKLLQKKLKEMGGYLPNFKD